MRPVMGALVRGYLRLFLLGTPREHREDLWREQMLLVFSVEESYRSHMRSGCRSAIALLRAFDDHLIEFWPPILFEKTRLDVLAVAPDHVGASRPAARSKVIVAALSGIAGAVLFAVLLVQTGVDSPGVGLGWAEDALVAPGAGTPSR